MDLHRSAHQPLSGPPRTAPSPIALALEHITKRFGQVEALADASLVVRAGTVHALLGENGAGKTTLMRIAFGELRPDAGTIRAYGSRAVLASPADALALGVGMVHQHFTAVPAMTVAENVALASGLHGRYHPARARARVAEVASEVGLALDPDARASDLSVGAQQRLEIVKALSRGASVLILDEPTAVLAPAETEELLATLRRFAERGGAVVIITHKLREALSVADEVTVLRRGRAVLAAARAAVSAASLASAMIGDGGEEDEESSTADTRIGAAVATASDSASNTTSNTASNTASNTMSGDPASETTGQVAAHAEGGVAVIDARDLVVADDRGTVRVRGATMRVYGGEIVGILGVEGAGQHELLRALAGRRAPSGGALQLPERIGFVPEDRQRDALVLDFTLYENVALGGAGRARGRIRWPEIISRTEDLIARHGIVAAGPRERASSLSGGNQQKLVLARELDGDPLALIVENPTRGLDIAGTTAMHRRLVAVRDAGVAVVLYSSDLDEVLAMANRLIVMYDGRAREVSLDRAAAGRAMLGAE